MATHLKLLLQQRHLQTHPAFCREYDRAAKSTDPDLVGSWPSRATLHRWMTGTVRKLPYPDHRRILEAMFPGWTTERLLQPCDEGVDTSQLPDVAGLIEVVRQGLADPQPGPAAWQGDSVRRSNDPDVMPPSLSERIAPDAAGPATGLGRQLLALQRNCSDA